ncbi:MAG TPA: S41 family peptidase [Flavitalea sp.]|nr:S41 family peptidase [Flavitalea sp.]
MKRYSVLSFMLATVIFAACKKEKDSGTPVIPPGEVSAADKVKDTVLMYSKDLYLWYKQIPTSFNARNYADPNKIMEALRQYSKEPGFTTPVDRWSFAYKQTEWDDVSSGVAQDFGLNVFFYANGDLRVKSVEPRSPAGIAGIRRGWRIKSINGNTNITTSNSDFIVQNVFNSTTTAFSFEKADGSTVNLSLNAGTYQENPIYLDTVYTAGTKKVGYLVFNSFLGDTSQVYSDFQRIFNRFSQQQVSELIVDLRYNGGGYVSVQDKLANYLVPTNANGNVMMHQEFNDNYSDWNETSLFSKLGSVSVPRIFFIVSNSTASASELLINNLKPYMDVKLVGPAATYGKPVGFFPVPVGDWYIFPVSFRSTNKNGEGNYFQGLPLDKQVADGLNKDWGDQTESALASALKFIETGSYSVVIPGETIGAAGNTGYKEQAVIAGNKKLDEPAFKGTVDVRKRFK